MKIFMLAMDLFEGTTGTWKVDENVKFISGDRLDFKLSNGEKMMKKLGTNRSRSCFHYHQGNPLDFRVTPLASARLRIDPAGVR